MRSTRQPAGRRIDPLLGGFPPTRWIKDRNGDRAIQVEVNALTPLRAKTADGLTAIGCFSVAVMAIIGAAETNAEPGAFILSLLVPPLAYWPVRFMLRGMFKKYTRVIFTKKTLEVRTAFSTKIYDRLDHHTFEYDEHWRAPREREEHQVRMRQNERRGQPNIPTRYYSESYHLTYRHRHQRRTIASVFSHPYDAQAYIDKFMLCDEEMETLLNHEDGGWRDEAGEMEDVA